MSSPVDISFKNFIQIDYNSKTPIYLQISEHFIKAIQLGYLPEGTQLPGSRVLCKELNINRNTLIKALEELQTQDWVAILPNKGTFILSENKKNKKSFGLVNSSKANANYTFVRSAVLDIPWQTNNAALQFTEGTADLRIEPIQQIYKVYASILRDQYKDNRSEKETFQNFHFQMLNYLNASRGLRASADNLFITSNHQTALYLVSKLLIAKADKILITDLGYHTANMIFASLEAQLLSVKTTEKGIDIEHLEHLCKNNRIKFLYLTSHYHYPTTISISPKQKIEIYNLAEKYNFIILEDDYDYDFNYSSASFPLMSFNAISRVIYVGLFGKGLPVAFRTGFVIGSPDLITELNKYNQIFDPEIDALKLSTLSTLIAEGEVNRFLKKARKIYNNRMLYLINRISTNPNIDVAINNPSGGLAIWCRWNNHINLSLLQKRCANKGLFIPQNTLYQNKDTCASRIGFAHLDYSEIDVATAILTQEIETLSKQ